jgi:RNase P/RNase MRP subunit POP5
MVRFERRRYLLVHAVVENGETGGEKIKEAVFNSYSKLFGLEGLSEAKLTWLGFDEKKGLGIIRCTHKVLPKVRAALALTSTLNGQRVRICTVKVSGTIRSIKDFVESRFKA